MILKCAPASVLSTLATSEVDELGEPVPPTVTSRPCTSLNDLMPERSETTQVETSWLTLPSQLKFRDWNWTLVPRSSSTTLVLWRMAMAEPSRGALLYMCPASTMPDAPGM